MLSQYKETLDNDDSKADTPKLQRQLATSVTSQVTASVTSRANLDTSELAPVEETPVPLPNGLVPVSAIYTNLLNI